MNASDFHGSVAFGAQLYLGHAIWMKVDEKCKNILAQIKLQLEPLEVFERMFTCLLTMTDKQMDNEAIYHLSHHFSFEI